MNTVSDIGAAGAFPVANGDYAVRLDERSDIGTDHLTQGGLSLTAGTEYTLSVDMWSQFGGGGSTLNVDFTGPATINAIVAYVDSVTGVETVSVNFTPTTTGSYTIELFNDSGTTNNHTWVDNVSVQEVPEPYSLALLGGSLFALLIRRRRQ